MNLRVRRDRDPNVIEVPKVFVWAITSVIFLAGGLWVRVEVLGEQQGKSDERQERQLAKLGEEVEKVKWRVGFSRAEAESMRADIMAEINAESRRTRAHLHARVDDLEERLSPVLRRRSP